MMDFLTGPQKSIIRDLTIYGSLYVPTSSNRDVIVGVILGLVDDDHRQRRLSIIHAVCTIQRMDQYRSINIDQHHLGTRRAFVKIPHCQKISDFLFHSQRFCFGNNLALELVQLYIVVQ